MKDKLHIVCPECTSTNSLPLQKLEDQPVCGKCKHKIFNAHPLELTSYTFESHLKHNHIPILVDFWAAWCGPCKMMAPVIEQAAARLEPYIRVAKLDTEKEQGLAAHYNIRSIPTIILFKNGKEQSRQSGAVDLDVLISWARENS